MELPNERPGEAAGPAPGDQAGRVAALLVRHRAELYAYTLAGVRNPHDAEDLHQELCLEAIRCASRFKPEADFPAWGRGIARNLILAFTRKSRQRSILIQPDLLDRLEGVARDMGEEGAAERRRKALSDCLDGLSRLARTAVRLRYGSRSKVPEIAASLGKTVRATYTILDAARQALRTCVRRKWSEA
ncbi:MAG: sigma-70 family RNA polymerase sigma factor [Planctomycetes bacterium]|nr:sigma-70 family RNA polymerase sigma factor [Planctomycetota bacterium]